MCELILALEVSSLCCCNSIEREREIVGVLLGEGEGER